MTIFGDGLLLAGQDRSGLICRSNPDMGSFFLYWMRLVRDSWDPWVSLRNNGSYGTFQSGSLKVTALEVTVRLVEDIYRVTGG